MSTASLLGTFSRAAGPAVAGRIRAIVEDGATPELDADTFAPCLALTPELKSGFEMGFDFRRSREDHVVRGVVPGSAAERAGVREGQKLNGWSVRFGDVDEPVTLKVITAEGDSELTYRPASAPVQVPQVRPAAGAAGKTGCGDR